MQTYANARWGPEQSAAPESHDWQTLSSEPVCNSSASPRMSSRPKTTWINYSIQNGKVVKPLKSLSHDQTASQAKPHRQLMSRFDLLPGPPQALPPASLLCDAQLAPQSASALHGYTLYTEIAGFDDEDKTVLMHAAASGDLTMAHTLLGCGVGINLTDANGWSAMDYAIEGAHFDVATLLLQHGGLIREQHLHHPSLLLDAVLMGKREFAMLLILLGASRCNVEVQGRSALHMAVEMQDAELVTQLVCAENINLQDAHGATALHLAASLADSQTTALLLQHQAAINLTDACGQTPLLCACALEDSTVAMQLLAAKAQTTQLNCQGQTPLIAAAQAGKLDVVRLLVVAGAEVNRPGARGCTALDLARQAGNTSLIAILQAAGGQ